jgi:hypothetical protein
MISNQFPTAYDVEQTLRYYNTSYDDLKRFLQSRGIFPVAFGKEQAAEFAQNILFNHDDYLLMRSLAQGADIATNISGFILKASLMPITLDDVQSDLVLLRKKLAQQESELMRKGAPIQRLDMPHYRDGLLRVRFDYERVIPGRVELMQRVDSKVDFTIEPSADDQLRVVCYPQADQDVKRVEELFQKMGRGAYAPFVISLDSFTQKQRIQFFDDILDYYHKNSEWSLQNVVEIAIKQRSDSGDEFVVGESDDGSVHLVGEGDEVQSVGEDDLLSITQAVLTGKNLRTNSFVKKCEKQGYFFPSMTLLLENRYTPEIIQVTIRFKLSPKMFEVVMAGMSEKSDMGELAVTFPAQRQQEILREFWNKSHEIWRDINSSTSKPTATGQLTFANA